MCQNVLKNATSGMRAKEKAEFFIKLSVVRAAKRARLWVAQDGKCHYCDVLTILIAEYLDTPNLSPNSYQPDYQFRLRPDLPIHFRDGTLLNTKRMMQEAQGVVAQIDRVSDDRIATY